MGEGKAKVVTVAGQAGVHHVAHATAHRSVYNCLVPG